MTNPPSNPEHPFTRPQGLRVDNSDLEQLGEALEAAFDYRGDVTIERVSASEHVTGFLFDRRDEHDPARATLRIIPADGSTRLSIPYADVAAIEFTGRDTAAGKSFETWMKKYVEKKLAGQSANIEAESLDEP